MLAADAGCEIRHPLLEPSVWSAIADAAPRHGYESRSKALEELFGRLLPTALTARLDKACFDEVFMRSPARAFARGWDGTGAPETLVDAEALRRHWLGAAPSAQSFTLLQATWLASSREGVEQPVGPLRERVPAAWPGEAPDRQ